MKYKYIIWDWNGTLLNDVDICIKVQNEMLESRGLRLIDSMDYYHSVFTFPIIDYYINLGYDLEKEDFTEICDIYVSKYEDNLKLCGLYSGARELMGEIKAAGVGQAVVSAASQRSLDFQMRDKGLAGLLDAAVGIADDMAHSKVEIAKNYIKCLDVSEANILFVGDSVHDFEVAMQCGCDAVLISAGHQSAEILETTKVPVFENLWGFRKYLFDVKN